MLSGGYADYRADVVAERQRLAAQQRLDSQPLPNSSPKKPSGGRSHQEKLKFSFKEQREYEEIDGVIAGLEEKIAQTESLIAQNASDYAALQELTAEKVKYLPSVVFHSMKLSAFSANFSSVIMPYSMKIFRSSHFCS